MRNPRLDQFMSTFNLDKNQYLVPIGICYHYIEMLEILLMKESTGITKQLSISIYAKIYTIKCKF